jgi:hypothetical protein
MSTFIGYWIDTARNVTPALFSIKITILDIVLENYIPAHNLDLNNSAKY